MTAYADWVVLGLRERHITRSGRLYAAVRGKPTEPVWELHEIDPESGEVLRTLAHKVLTRDLDKVLEALVP